MKLSEYKNEGNYSRLREVEECSDSNKDTNRVVKTSDYNDVNYAKNSSKKGSHNKSKTVVALRTDNHILINNIITLET